MPRPNQTLGVAFRRALSLRAAFAPTCAAKVGAFFGVFCGPSLMVKAREAANKAGFQFRHDRAHALLVLVQGHELLLHRITQLAEVRSAQSPVAPRRARPGRS